MTEECSYKTVFIILILSAITAISCDSVSTVCSSEFRYLGVSVFMEDGTTPVVFDEVILTDGQSGQSIELCGKEEPECSDDYIMGIPESGSYTIFHDGLRNRIGFYPMKLLFEGRNESITVKQVFLIGDDGCHVNKLSGPTTLNVKTE